MSEHERSFEVNVSADEAFRFLSSVDNIPAFVPHIKELKEDHGQEVFGRAEMDGKNWEMSGFFRPSESDKRIDWGSDGTPDYHGYMKIEAAGGPSLPDQGPYLAALGSVRGGSAACGIGRRSHRTAAGDRRRLDQAATRTAACRRTSRPALSRHAQPAPRQRA